METILRTVWRRLLGACTTCVEGVAGLIVPPRCWACGGILDDASGDDRILAGFFCAACANEVSLLDGVVCALCGLPGVESPFDCRRCAGRPRGFRRVAAGAAYRGPVRDLVLRLKFGRDRDAAWPLAYMALAAAYRVQDLLVVDCVTAVPLHPARRRRRGFDQAEVLAGIVADALKTPFLPGVVRRVRNTAPQGGGGDGSRRANVDNAFAPRRDGWYARLRGQYPAHLVTGRHVLLVDDVLSTGNTLDQCAKALLDAGALTVSGAVCAT